MKEVGVNYLAEKENQKIKLKIKYKTIESISTPYMIRSTLT
jgi:hypothetical protein